MMIWRRTLAAVDRNHVRLLQVPAEERDPEKLLLRDETWPRKELREAKRLPCRLMFRGDDEAAAWNVLDAENVVVDAADGSMQPERRRDPEAADRPEHPLRQKQDRRKDDGLDEKIQIERDVEEEGAQEHLNLSPTVRREDAARRFSRDPGASGAPSCAR
jgi:hypothetical protein